MDLSRIFLQPLFSGDKPLSTRHSSTESDTSAVISKTDGHTQTEQSKTDCNDEKSNFGFLLESSVSESLSKLKNQIDIYMNSFSVKQQLKATVDQSKLDAQLDLGPKRQTSDSPETMVPPKLTVNTVLKSSNVHLSTKSSPSPLLKTGTWGDVLDTMTGSRVSADSVIKLEAEDKSDLMDRMSDLKSFPLEHCEDAMAEDIESDPIGPESENYMIPVSEVEDGGKSENSGKLRNFG